MKVLISKFVTDESMDLIPFADSDMQIAFFKRKTFRDFDHERFYQRLIEHNINVASIHAPATDVYHQQNDEFINTLKTIQEVYKVKIITLHPQRGEKKLAKHNYRKLEQQIMDMGIILAYETFEKEAINIKWISQLEDMHKYFDLLKMPFLGITYDFTHSTYENCLDEVRKYNQKIHVIHFSDALRDKPLDLNEYHQHLPLGFGTYRVKDFIDLLIEINYQHIIVLEYYPEYDHLLKNDAALLRQYINGEKDSLLELLNARSIK